MNELSFLNQYINALKEALSEDQIDSYSFVKFPNWYYPKEISREMEEMENVLYKKYPIMEKALYYFDAKSENSSPIQEKDLKLLRKELIHEIQLLDDQIKEWNLISFYDENIRSFIRQVDVTLNKLDQQSLFVNPDYSIDELSCESYLKLNFRRQNSISFYLLFTNSEIEIGIDRIVEAVFLEKKSIENSPDILNEWITLLYTSYIQIDYYGATDVYVSFINNENKLLRQIKDWGTIWGPLHSMFSKHTRLEYFPICGEFCNPMNDEIFFKYYIPAFKKALVEASQAEDFFCTAPNWYYPKNLMRDLMLFEDSHYDEYPILEKVAYYFHAVEHNFPSFEGIDIDDYKQMILDEIGQLEKEFSIEDN